MAVLKTKHLNMQCLSAKKLLYHDSLFSIQIDKEVDEYGDNVGAGVIGLRTVFI